VAHRDTVYFDRTIRHLRSSGVNVPTSHHREGRRTEAYRRGRSWTVRAGLPSQNRPKT
jgi:hypothetical protein